MTYKSIFENKYGSLEKQIPLEMTRAQSTAWEILSDITDRRGWSQEWDQFDEGIKNEVFATFVAIIEKNYA
jgi:hypothetical protein